MKSRRILGLLTLAICLSQILVGRTDAAEPEARTRLGVRGTDFTVNDAPAFLLGCSYYGALGADAKAWQADLDDMQRAGFNWIRVWATWAAFDRDVSAVVAVGRPREAFLEKLKSLLAECDRRGIVVDMTLSRGNGSTGPARLQSHEAHRRAVETVVTALKPWRNWYIDLGNERNIRDSRFVSTEDVKDLRARVRELDAARLATASHGGDLTADDLRNYVINADLDFVAPHRPRDRASPGQTEQRTRQLLQAMKALGRVVPIHFQEPFRRGYQGFVPEVIDYQNDLRGAIDGGAAGWCFHNGPARGAPDEQPRRSFDLSEKRLFAQLDAVEHDAVSRLHELVPAVAGPFRVRHARLADLGGEHVAHAIFRRTPSGGAIVGWGERILEWPLDKPILHEAIPRQPGFEYSNGGCALDVDGDGSEEIVVARGRTRSCSDPDLLWFKETGAGKFWTEHQVGNIGKGPIAPHDIQPFSARRPDGSAVRGVVAVIDRRQLVWYQIPDDPARPWLLHEIAELPLASQSGIAVGNLAGNDRPDVACGMFWAECPADPIRDPWTVRRFGHWEDGGWGGMAKLELADMDGDGLLEIVASEAEIPEARLGVFSRDPQHPDAVWKCREIEAGLYCPHSLVLADLDGDSRTDIVIGEMTAGGWSFPLNPRPRILAFLNHGDKPFDRHVLAEGLGVHEMGLVPHQRDGAWVVFAADEIQPQKFADMKTHVSSWTIELQTQRPGLPETKSGGGVAATPVEKSRALETPSAVDFFVSPRGQDTWSGRSADPGENDGPFATVARAREAVRKLRQSQKEPRLVRVVVRGGTYYLDSSLEFGPEDSGTEMAPVIYAAATGEKVVLSGGRRLEGGRWGDVKGRKAWLVDIPEVKGGLWRFRQLFVNGARCPRTRLPKQGEYQIQSLPGYTGDFLRSPTKQFNYAPGDIVPDWRNLRDVEIVGITKWLDNRLPIESVRADTRTVTFDRPSLFALLSGEKPGPYWVENIFEALDTDGQWYLDRPTGVLSYLPRPDEEMLSAEIIAPRLPQVLRVVGRAGAPVHDIHFEGLIFSHTEWQPPANYASSLQAGIEVPGALLFDYAERSTVTGGRIEHIGNYGVEVNVGCADIEISRNQITDIGAGGIRIGHFFSWETDGSGQLTERGLQRKAAMPKGPHSRRIIVADNEIARCGRLTPEAVGVFVGDNAENQVIHNHIHDLFYSGISVGSVQDFGPSQATGNVIEYNHVHDVGQGMLSDLAAIYTCSAPDSRIRFNLLHDVSRRDYGGWGIYPDEGSHDLLIQKNLVFRCQDGALFAHHNRNITAENNIFAFNRAQIERGGIGGFELACRRNIVYFTDGKAVGDYGSAMCGRDVCAFDRNLYWNDSGKPTLFGPMTFAEWQAVGQDQNSLIADPMFVAPEKGDFRLRPDSPAAKIGFEPWDFTAVGPRSSRAVGTK